MLLLIRIPGQHLFPHGQVRQRRAHGLPFLIPALLIYGNKAGEAEALVGGAEGVPRTAGIDGYGIIQGICHLACQEPAPDQLIEPVLVRRQAAANPLGIQLHMGRPDGLVGILGGILGLIYMEGAVIILLAVALGDKAGGGGHGLVAEALGIGTHIGNEAQGAFALHIHAFIELLGHHHGLPGGHVQLAGCLLLQGGGGKGRRSRPLFLRFFHIGDGKGLAGNVIDHRLGHLFGFQLPLLFLTVIMGHKGAGVADPVQRHVQRPVLPGLEGTDLLLPVHHHPGGHALHPSGGQAPADLFPKQGGQLIAHDPVQNPSRLLGIHQIVINIPGIADGILHHLLGDLVEGDPVGLAVRQVQQLLQVPGNGLSLPVRVRCQIDRIRLFGGGLQFLNEGLFAPNRQIFRGEIMLQIHAHSAFRQIPQMAHAGFHHIIGPQVFADGFCFGRRLNDHQIVGFCHEKSPFPGMEIPFRIFDAAGYRFRATRLPGRRQTFPFSSSMVRMLSTLPAPRPAEAIT